MRPEQQAGPAHLNFRGNAQGRRQQREAHEVGPEQTPGHIRGHHGHEPLRSGEMKRAKDRERNRETQIAQGDDLVQAAGPREVGPHGPQANHKKHDAGAAHRDPRTRDLRKYGENSSVHIDTKQPACFTEGVSLSIQRFSCKTKRVVQLVAHLQVKLFKVPARIPSVHSIPFLGRKSDK